MTNSKREYNEFIRANLPYGITYDSARYQYVTFNGKRFVTYLEAKWYIDYLTKFGGFPDRVVGYLFENGEEGVWYDTSDISTLFQDSAGTTPITASGQTIGFVRDKSGNGLNATQATTAARPSYIVDADGAFIQHDPVDDALTVTLPDMGTAATVAYVTRSEVRLLEDQTLNGSYALPTQEIANFVAIDRALTLAEKVSLIRFLAAKVEGVNYGAEIDRLTLIAINAVDVFVYDTSKDSDGGAWAVSYPDQMVIVAESASVKIYDATAPDLPLHTTLDFTGYTVTSLAAIEGVLSVGTSTGLATLNLADDDVTVALDYTTSTTPAIVNSSVNDVAMTVLPDAPIDPATGLPVPTIAVATDGGVSVIKDDGTVVDITGGIPNSISFTEENRLSFDFDVVAGGSRAFRVLDIPSVDTNLALPTKPAGSQYYTTAIFAATYPEDVAFLNGYAAKAVPNAVGFRSGISHLALIAPKPDDNTKAMIAFVTSTYNTGWMNGDIKGAFLSDTDDTDLVGGTDNDRSVNANPLTVNGTVTRSPVADGAELVGYGGFSAANYLEQPYNSALDFGTGDFCVMGWVAPPAVGIQRTIFSKGPSGTNTSPYFELRLDGDNTIKWVGNNSTTRLSTSALTASIFYHICFVRSGGFGYLYVNGAQVATSANSDNYDHSNTDTLRVGGRHDGAASAFTGSLALLRISATAPTAEQIAKIYNDEKVLFQENAQATLYGTSDAVTALAHDPDTDLLHVGTSAGRSVFEGLRRVGNTTTSVSTAISASGGLVVEK